MMLQDQIDKLGELGQQIDEEVIEDNEFIYVIAIESISVVEYRNVDTMRPCVSIYILHINQTISSYS